VQGSTTEKTFCSRIRRAISCVYCEPKSRMTIVWVATIFSVAGRILRFASGIKFCEGAASSEISTSLN